MKKRMWKQLFLVEFQGTFSTGATVKYVSIWCEDRKQRKY